MKQKTYWTEDDEVEYRQIQATNLREGRKTDLTGITHVWGTKCG